jgi:hypothetical protein
MTSKLIDVLAVLIFVAIGRRSHEQANSISGLLQTAAPFLIALAVSWLVLALAKPSGAFVPALIVWAITVTGGMLLRNLAFGEGTATSFIVVTTITLFVLIVGARLASARLF